MSMMFELMNRVAINARFLINMSVHYSVCMVFQCGVCQLQFKKVL